MDFGGGEDERLERMPVGLGGADGAAARVDVAIVGAGLAGALLALALARRGVGVAVIDPNPVFKADFRCEKLHAAQIAALEALGLADALAAGLPPGGRLADSGFRYEDLVNAARAAWPASVRFILGQVGDVRPAEDERQAVVCDSGEVAHARLVVLATGLNPKLAARLGFDRQVLREQQSISIGFSLARKDGGRFPFEGRAQAGQRAGDGIGFVSLFRTGDVMRVNAFIYRDPGDPWIREVRADPLAAIARVAPKLAPVLETARLAGPVEMRATHLYRVADPVRPGLVLIGDAFQTACPSAAYGVTRIAFDVGRLVDHIPAWLESAGMGEGKIAAFYANPAKQAVDAEGLRLSARARAMASETGLDWRARRLAAAGKRAAVALLRPSTPAQATFRRGDAVRVRSAAEVAATLDADGKLDGLPFMPEMAALIGRRLRVVRRAEKTCVEGHPLRGMRDTVFLEDARCDGAAHDGCERGCLIFWKEAWLASADEPALAPDARVEAVARRRLESLPTRAGALYACQSTALAGATYPLARYDVGHLIDDLRRGELAPGRFVEIAARTAVNVARRRLGLPDVGALSGPGGKRGAALGLAAGERVRVRPAAEIAATLDAQGRNRGMSFEPEMTLEAGRRHVVATPVRRIILETTGRMATLKSTVSLEGVDCQGRCARNCPRANPLYWREAWLERA
jgi:2-polyprenyl-6-methoxyphenol hydroxylase-like FAD-dependent oxidoreductase